MKVWVYWLCLHMKARGVGMRVRNKLMWWCGALVGSEECGWWREERGLGAVERCGGWGMRVEGVRYLWKACGGRVVGFEKGVWGFGKRFGGGGGFWGLMVSGLRIGFAWGSLYGLRLWADCMFCQA